MILANKNVLTILLQFLVMAWLKTNNLTQKLYMINSLLLLIKQILRAFLFNIRNYSPEVINIQRRGAGLSIILSRVNNFDIKQKKPWNICFIILGIGELSN